MDILAHKGTPIDRQTFSWRELVGAPISKLDSDAFTRVRVILMNAIEAEQCRFLHALARCNRDLRVPAARIRRIEHQQQTLVGWLSPPDQSPLETTIAHEQAAIEVTAAVAQLEPDAYFAQVYRFGMLEDFDHLYRFAALLDRLDGRDANAIVQSYSDIMPGRPTAREHRAPIDDVRKPYRRDKASPVSKWNALTLVAVANRILEHAMTVGPQLADPLARGLYAEVASIEEQHVTQYESLLDPDETWLERWMLHEANEVWNYWSCLAFEDDLRIKRIWERMCDYELGQLHFVMELMREVEHRDPEPLLPPSLGEPLEYREHREYVRTVLEEEVGYVAVGTEIGELEESADTLGYRDTLNAGLSPSQVVAAGYRWSPGTELIKQAQLVHHDFEKEKRSA